MVGSIPENWPYIKITPHFLIGESFKQLDVSPTPDCIDSLYCIHVCVLEPVREAFGPVIITSGFRSDVANTLVGGEATSQHLRGKAVDFMCKNKNMLDVYKFIIDKLKWKGETLYYKIRGHVHVGLPEYGVKSDHLILDK